MADTYPKRRRSEIWFNDQAEPGETGVYLETGACLEFAVPYRDLRKIVPRHSH